MGLPRLVGRFVVELRAGGLPVSVTESMDAHRALAEVDLADRSSVRAALSTCLVKSETHLELFEALFECWWSPGPLPAEAEVAVGGGPALVPSVDGPTAMLSPGQLEEKLVQLLCGWQDTLGEAVAAAAVDAHAGMDTGAQARAAGLNLYLFRTLRGLHLDEAVAASLGRVGAVVAASGWEEQGDARSPGLDLWLERARIRRSAEQLRRSISSEIRRRLVERQGAGEVARSSGIRLVEEIDFAHASADELAAMAAVVRPLAIRLAARLERRRRQGHRGSLDFRATMRRSLSTGGVPLETRWRRPRRAKPEIFVLADVSGSVAAFSRFSLILVHALSAQFTKVRSFAFVDEVDEVTGYFEAPQDFAVAVARVRREADVVGALGHSHYGRALSSFEARFGAEIGPRTTVLVLGDARSNFHPPEVGALAALASRARRLYWLDPEPRSYWSSGDSVLGLYAGCCDAVFECRNLAQLAEVVSQLD